MLRVSTFVGVEQYTGVTVMLCSHSGMRVCYLIL